MPWWNNGEICNRDLYALHVLENRHDLNMLQVLENRHDLNMLHVLVDLDYEKWYIFTG